MPKVQGFGFVSPRERQEADAFFAELMGVRPPARPRLFPWAGEVAREDDADAVAPNIRRWNDPAITQKRKKVLAIIGNLFPMIWQDVHARWRTAQAEHGGGLYYPQGEWKGPGTSCTAASSIVGSFASSKTEHQWAFKAHENSAWVPWGAHPTKKMPSVGDVFLFYSDNPEQGLAHVGIIVEVPSKPGELWVMADGGQKAYGKEAAHLVVRSWELRTAGPSNPARQREWHAVFNNKDHAVAKPLQGIQYPYLVGGAEATSSGSAKRLIGWLDIDALPFDKEEFDPPQPTKRRGLKFTEEDYKSLGAKIDSVLALYRSGTP